MVNPLQIIPASGVGMKQFIEQNGWEYYANCNCANNMSKYRHAQVNDKEIWINGMQTRMEIRLKFASNHNRDTRVKALAGRFNFEHIYNMFIA